MSEGLKLCPFCGGEAELKCLPVIKGATWFVGCSGCSASSSSSNTEEEAIEKWNKRIHSGSEKRDITMNDNIKPIKIGDYEFLAKEVPSEEQQGEEWRYIDQHKVEDRRYRGLGQFQDVPYRGMYPRCMVCTRDDCSLCSCQFSLFYRGYYG